MKRLDRITDHLNRQYVEPGKIAGCQTLVARFGEVVYQQSLGQADLARAKPINDETLFRIYSMTKPITSVALMMLYERGYFQLYDAVERVVPEWSEQRVWVAGEGATMQLEAAKRPITFRDLLTHTGGLTYGGGLPGVGAEHPVDQIYKEQKIRSFGGKDPLAVFLRKLGRVPLMFQPGTHFMYSISTDVCGALVELLSGQRFDEFLRENIFEPLEMVDTAFHVTADKRERFAANYRRRADKTLELIDDPKDSPYLHQPVFFSGGGGLVSTTRDYLRFCEMLRRGGELDGQRLLSPRTIQLMHKNHLPNGHHLSALAVGQYAESKTQGVGFGLGLASVVDQIEAGSVSEGDYYWGGAASTIFWIDPKEELVVIFMTQLMPSRSFDFRGQLKSLVYSALVD
ncbi:MAG TPA: serine hydrolase domain-containing protein [Polyangiales bacterium]|nr:serine hydrolase domain-containing protein [Polyangiales bacterium]